LICSNCGTENPSGGKFCVECAAPLSAVCPNCGHANIPTAKFCAECATPLTGVGATTAATGLPAGAVPGVTGAIGAAGGATSPEAERRLVTVLFADLVGFTPFAEERDAEDVRDTLSRYFDIAQDVIGRYGGTIEKFIGDAVMAVWGAPTAHEDDAERAVRAALELVDAVRVLGEGIQARAGVLTGEAAVTIGATNQGMVAGDLVNTASRLQSVAKPGAVLVGETTFRAAAGAIAFEPAGDQALKGKSAPVPAWQALRVVAERGGRNRTEALEAPFVGRDDELRLLKDLFHATGREQRIRLVSVVGPAGIGKSRLAWELAKYLDGLVERAWWHDGRSPAYGEGITFWALGEMVRGRAGLRETDDEATTRARIAETVIEHVPDPDERRWIEPALLALLGYGDRTGGVSSEQLFAAWRTFFERLSASGPVVMVFEDLQWADSGMLDFIDHLLEWSRNVPIYVLTLSRPDLLERRPDWGAGKRNFAGVYLEPLPEKAMRELLAGLVPGLPESAVRTIVARADGVPLYAVETVRMLVAEGSVTLADGAYRPTGDLTDLAIPETLTALIASRLDGLGPADRALVADAAVLGQTFTIAGLSAVSGVDEADLERRLPAFAKRELLRLEVDPRSPERGQYSFVQALVRDVAYNTLAKKERKAKHLAAARFFESLGTDELAGALAGHYLSAWQSAPEGAEADALAVQARLALAAAAERAVSLGAHDQAVSFLEQALSVTKEPAERVELLARAAQSAEVALRNPDAERFLGEAIDLARAGGDRARVLGLTAFLVRVIADQAHPARALELGEAAWAEMSDLADTADGARLMAALARANSGLDRFEAGLAWTEKALELSERLGRDDIIANALISRASALVRENRSREGMILMRGAAELGLSAGVPEAERRARTLETFYSQWSDPRAGLASARLGQELARKQGSRRYLALMAGNAVSCATRVGEWDWAVALIDEWIEENIDRALLVELLADRATIEAGRGSDPAQWLGRAEALLPELTDPQFRSYVRMGSAWTALAEGRLRDASELARTAVTETSYFGAMGLPLAARADLWAGDRERVAATADELAAGPWRGTAVETDRASVRAGLAALEGRSADALAGYRDALRSWRDLGCAWDEALAAIDMATLLDPSEPEVRAAADSAREILTRLGARPFLARLEAALARSDTRPTAARSQAGTEAATPVMEPAGVEASPTP
jgi:class 3 adenylate cyclase